ncbi:g13361 [Coccomyxa viridis]|uniref:G13361 protein n=1 Tax=Coccomyxa viridis TaxID=1274662 RepID=A0ABP1GF51_9CHLO
MNLDSNKASLGAPRHPVTVNRRKARAPKRAASGDDAELLDRHRQEVLHEQPRPQPQQKLFQGRAPQSLAGMRRLKNAPPPPQVLEGKRKRHASTWLMEFVKDLPQSPVKDDDHTQKKVLEEDRSPSPAQLVEGARSLGPPNAEFLGLGPVPKKRRSAGAGPSIPTAEKPEDSGVKAWQGDQVPAVPGDEKDMDAFTAVRRALQLQQGSPQILVNAHHLQQLLDTLKAFQALLGCQGLAAQQGKLQPAVIDAANIRLSAQHASPTTLSHATPQGAKPLDAKPAQHVLSGSSLKQLIKPSSTSPASLPVRSAHQMTKAPNASLPPILEQLKSLTSFKRLDGQHLSSAAFQGISVPVQQSLPASSGAERRVQAPRSVGQVDKHPGSRVPEDLGHSPSCRAVTRSARSPAEGGSLIAN